MQEPTLLDAKGPARVSRGVFMTKRKGRETKRTRMHLHDLCQFKQRVVLDVGDADIKSSQGGVGLEALCDDGKSFLVEQVTAQH